MADKCWCESAKEDIEKAYKNPNPYHGALQDIMDAEIDYAKMCEICPCRKRRLEGEDPVEPEKKRKEAESEEQEPDGPRADNKQADEEDDDPKSDLSFLITELTQTKPTRVRERRREKRSQCWGQVQNRLNAFVLNLSRQTNRRARSGSHTMPNEKQFWKNNERRTKSHVPIV